MDKLRLKKFGGRLFRLAPERTTWGHSHILPVISTFKMRLAYYGTSESSIDWERGLSSSTEYKKKVSSKLRRNIQRETKVVI